MSHVARTSILVERSKIFVNLNVSCDVFKFIAIHIEENDEEQTISLIDGYK